MLPMKKKVLKSIQDVCTWVFRLSCLGSGMAADVHHPLSTLFCTPEVSILYEIEGGMFSPMLYFGMSIQNLSVQSLPSSILYQCMYISMISVLNLRNAAGRKNNTCKCMHTSSSIRALQAFLFCCEINTRIPVFCLHQQRHPHIPMPGQNYMYSHKDDEERVLMP